MTVNGIAYPADAVASSPIYTALQGRNSFSAAMAGATSARPLGGINGVRAGTPITTVTASSTVWGVGSFAGYIDLESSTTNSGYFFSVAANASGGSVTAAAGSARVDLIYVQIADSNTGDGSSGSPRVIVDYQAGTAGAGIPTLAAARAFVIAQINVPLSGGGSPTVTWVAPYTTAAGGMVFANTAAALPVTGFQIGTYGLVLNDATTGNNAVWRWNGTAWKAWDGDWNTIAIGAAVSSGLTTGGSGTSAFAWRYRQGRVAYRGYVTIAAGGGWVSPVLTLPVAALTPTYSGRRYSIGGGDISHSGANYPLNIYASGTSTTLANIAQATVPAGGVSNSNPVTTAIGDSLSFEFEYDPA